MNKQLEFDGLGEAELYHKPQGRGFFSVLWNDEEEKCKRQKSWRVTDMPTVIQLLPCERDTWISQAEFFRPNRRLVNLTSLALNFVDVDYYHSRHVESSRDVVVFNVLNMLDDKGVPLPSLMLDSGRGLQLKWLLDTAIPRQALPRWNAIQNYLVASLEDFGADARAKDASRVLRLVNTVNTRANRFVNVCWMNENNGELVHYGFDELAEYVLPFTRDELAAAKAERVERKTRTQLRVINGGLHGLQRLGEKQLAWDRLEDLRTLSRLRGWAGGHPAGERDLFIFWATNFAALGGVEPGQLYRESVALAKEFAPTWSHHEAQAAVGTVVRKAHESASGLKVEFNGHTYPPLYTPRNSTLMSQFRVTPEEERQLKTIISKDEKRRRDRARDTKRRRERGAVEREAYLAQVAGRRSEARRMAGEGLTQAEIAERLGVTQRAVSNYLRG